jgi:CRISPR-associated protein Csb2
LSFTKPPLEYRQVPYRQKREPIERHYTCFQLLTLDGRHRYRRDPRQAIAVAAMLRHAVHEVLQREDHTLSQIQDLMGHGQRHRQMTFLPLPSVGHPQADGLIRRVMLNMPDSAILHRLQWALDGRELQADGNPVAMLSLIEERDTVVERFTGGSHLWETVTPVVLPGYDQRGVSKWKTEKLICRALQQSGFALTEVQDIWYQPAPWHRRGHRAGTYRVADYMRYPQYHVRVRFRNPVKGPVALGAGRYFGLGLMGRRC